MKLEVKNGTFYYKKNTHVLKDINLSLTDGDILAVLGANGAGKTTLLKCILGILLWKNGNTFLDGQNIKNISHYKIWTLVSYVPQAKNVVSSLCVIDYVLLGLSGQLGVFSSPDEKQYKQAFCILQELGIEKLKDKQCDEISGGELQMVLIAKSLISNPKILILDEPESNLDFRNQLIVLDTITKLSKKGLICIFNTHYPEHALQRSNKALLIYNTNGYFGNTNEIVTTSSIQKAFGVSSYIGSFETDNKCYKTVMPLKLSDNKQIENSQHSEVLANVTVLINSIESSSFVNDIFHKYSNYIVGRMGMPYKKKDVNIINIIIFAKKNIIDNMVQSLSVQLGVSVKVTYQTD